MRRRLLTSILVLLLVAACSGADTGDPGADPSLTSQVAPSTTPVASTPTTGPAPLTFSWDVDTSLNRGDGYEVISNGEATARFASGRIVLTYDDPAELAAFLERYSGTVVGGYSLGDYGLPGPSVASVQVDPSAGDLDALSRAMSDLGVEGATTFGSEEGALLGAIAAVERAAGHRVALEWLTLPASIPGSTQEDPVRRPPWQTDAYELAYYQRDAVQGIGVAEAWSLMFYAGVLDNRVPVAIIDRGFLVDEDYRDPLTHAMDPSLAPFGEEDAGWHGYDTSSIAVAIPDNGYGIAGVAGVVAEPILIQMGDPLLSDSTEAVLQAHAMGARIINMSFIVPILAEWADLGDTWDMVTSAVAADGVLLFASSGNGGGNVDQAVAERPGLIGTRPCQSPAVICVGGLDFDSTERHEDSVYGNPGGSVPIFAPYCVHTYPPGESRTIFWTCGTSLSSPFAAGVAALIWAANPSLTADEVRDLLLSIAQGTEWPRVNAYDAVASALPAILNVEFLEPVEGSGHEMGTAVTLAASVLFPTDTSVTSTPVRVVFSSASDGVIDDHTWTVPMQHDDVFTVQRVSTVANGLSEGTHTITVEVGYSGGTATATRQITIGNSPPSDLRILSPGSGSSFCAGANVVFRGDAFDINEQLGLPENAFRWRSSIDGVLGRGRNYATSSLGVGSHEITLRAVDSGGLRTSTSIDIVVLSASHSDCRDLPPEVRIVSPEDGDSFYVDDPALETGVDAEGPYLVVRLLAEVTDDHDAEGAMQIDFYVTPDEGDPWMGSGNDFEVRLHLPDGVCSLPKLIRVVVFDTAGNRAEDLIEVFLNRVC